MSKSLINSKKCFLLDVTPAIYSQKEFKYLNKLFLINNFSIFDESNTWLNEGVFVHGASFEIKEILNCLTSSFVAKKLNIKYTKLKEWPSGRKPISVGELKKLVRLCPDGLCNSIKSKLSLSDLRFSCKYSPHKVKFPLTISEDLAYIIGIILGDGTLSGNSNKKKRWVIRVYFDNLQHRLIFNELIEKEVGIQPINSQRKKNCFESTISSKIIYLFISNYFGLHIGRKAHKIEFPSKLLNGSDKIKCALIQGLFDSDGTITNGAVKYSTVSKIMAEQVKKVLLGMNINTGLNVWIKDAKYFPLYTISVKSGKNKLIFAEKIGFKHPIKRILLEDLFY